MSKISEDEAVDALDEKQLESMGYTQQLKVRLRCVAPAACLRLLNPPPLTPQRGLGFWGSVGITLGAMQPLSSAGVFQLGARRPQRAALTPARE